MAGRAFQTGQSELAELGHSKYLGGRDLPDCKLGGLNEIINVKHFINISYLYSSYSNYNSLSYILKHITILIYISVFISNLLK